MQINKKLENHQQTTLRGHLFAFNKSLNLFGLYFKSLNTFIYLFIFAKRLIALNATYNSIKSLKKF